jgi:hypothetical protein
VDVIWGFGVPGRSLYPSDRPQNRIETNLRPKILVEFEKSDEDSMRISLPYHVVELKNRTIDETSQNHRRHSPAVFHIFLLLSPLPNPDS